jgi:hypothetical protein
MLVVEGVIQDVGVNMLQEQFGAVTATDPDARAAGPWVTLLDAKLRPQAPI